MTDHSTMRLGCRPVDPKALAAAPKFWRHHYGMLAPAQDLSARARLAFTPGLYQNDTLPDCTAVGTANHLDWFSLLRAGTRVAIDPAKVPAFYARSIGLPAATSAADLAETDGADPMLVLATSQLDPACDFGVGEQVPYVPDYASCDPANRWELAVAIDQCAAGWWCVQLALADQQTEVWDTNTPAAAGDPTPGSWGGHLLLGAWYDGLGDTNLVSLFTWGGVKQATWRWVRSRLNAAFALRWRQVLQPGQLQPDAALPWV